MFVLKEIVCFRGIVWRGGGLLCGRLFGVRLFDKILFLETLFGGR